MGKDKKYALLDTDFIYKSHLARNSDDHTLIEFVLEFSDYEFFCHDMVKEELKRHEITPDPNPCLEDNIKSGKIKLYSDRDIIANLSNIYGDLAIITYLSLLKMSCDTFNAGFFDEYYGTLESTPDIEGFLKALKECDDKIPHQNGVGEKKSFVLVQMMEILYGNKVYVFCSDDFKARQSIAGLSRPINCLSILGVFYKLMKMGHEKTEMLEYYNQLSAFLKNQTEYKVWSISGHQRIRVPMEQVLNDIYDGKFQLLRNGDLQYIK